MVSPFKRMQFRVVSFLPLLAVLVAASPVRQHGMEDIGVGDKTGDVVDHTANFWWNPFKAIGQAISEAVKATGQAVSEPAKAIDAFGAVGGVGGAVENIDKALGGPVN